MCLNEFFVFNVIYIFFYFWIDFFGILLSVIVYELFRGFSFVVLVLLGEDNYVVNFILDN